MYCSAHKTATLTPIQHAEEKYGVITSRFNSVVTNYIAPAHNTSQKQIHNVQVDKGATI